MNFWAKYFKLGETPERFQYQPRLGSPCDHTPSPFEHRRSFPWEQEGGAGSVQGCPIVIYACVLMNKITMY